MSEDEIASSTLQGYMGDVDGEGRPHGHGTYRWENGNAFTGAWEVLLSAQNAVWFSSSSPLINSPLKATAMMMPAAVMMPPVL